MWCKQCGQDVPSIGSPTSLGLCCARCGTVQKTGANADATVANLARSARYGLDLGGLAAVGTASTSFDDWSLAQSVRALQARAGISPRKARPAIKLRSRPQQTRRRVDSAHTPSVRGHTSQPRTGVGSSFLAWGLMLLGLMVFVCGVVLIGWSILEDRQELWNIGLPAAAVGQVALLFGLILQVERVWQNSRYAVGKLDQVDSHLNSLERTTDLLGMTHNSASQAFYAHMADQSNPRLLLADLKGQLDLLAMSIANRE